MSSSNNPTQMVNRTFVLSDNINQASVGSLIEKIIQINMYDDEMEEQHNRYQRTPITLVVNSYGGSIYDGFALIAAIEMSTTPITTICLGAGMSMGLAIFASGHNRLIHELASLMYHEALFGEYGNITEIKERTDETIRMMIQYDMYLVSKSKVPYEKLDEVKRDKKNWFIDAHQAMTFGLADAMIPLGKSISWSLSSQLE